jgi:hypothetical protein
MGEAELGRDSRFGERSGCHNLLYRTIRVRSFLVSQGSKELNHSAIRNSAFGRRPYTQEILGHCMLLRHAVNRASSPVRGVFREDRMR